MEEEIAVMEDIREPSDSDVLVLGTEECRREDDDESDAGKVDVDIDIESQKEMSIDLVVDCPGIPDESSHEPAPSTELILVGPSEKDECQVVEGVINAEAKESDGEMSTELAESIIPKDGQINMRNSKGETPLILAAKNGHLETILLLLSCGANVEMSDDEGNSALMHATIGNHTPCITALLNHGSSMTHTNNLELSPFRLAMSGGHCEAQKAMAQFLQESGFCEYVKRSTLQNSRLSMKRTGTGTKATLGKKPQCQDLKRVQKIIGRAKKRVNGFASDKVMTRKSNNSNSNEETTSSTDKVEPEETNQNVELSPKKQLLGKVPPKESQIQSVISEVRKDPKRPLKVSRQPYPRQRPRQPFQLPWQPRGLQDFQRFRPFQGCNLGHIKTQKPGPGLSYQSRPLLSPPGYVNQGFPMNFNRSAPGYNNLGFPGPQNFPPNNSVSIHPSFPLPLHRNFTPRW